MENKQTRQVKCPQCGRLTFFSPENPYRPFCSERCRLLDLGQWASESYKVPTEDSSSDALSELSADQDDEP